MTDQNNMNETLKGVGEQEVGEKKQGLQNSFKKKFRPLFRAAVGGGVVVSGAMSPVIEVPGGNIDRTDRAMIEASDDKGSTETPVAQETADYDSNRVYEMESVPMTESTKGNIESFKETSRVIAEGEGVDSTVYALEVPLVREGENLELPFEYDGDEFTALAESLLNWADGMERSDGQEPETGDISISMMVIDDEVVMALKLNKEMILNEYPLAEGTLFAYDHANDRVHYLSPLVDGQSMALLNVDQVFLDSLREAGLTEAQLPELGTVVMVHGDRNSNNEIKLTSIALGDVAFVWTEQLDGQSAGGAQESSASAPSTPEPTAFKLRPEAMMPLGDVLTGWVDGSLELPDARRFTKDGEPFRLGYISDEMINPNQQSGVEIVGVLLGTEVVGGVLVGYIGVEDVSGNRAYFPIDFGNMNEQSLKVAVWENPGRSLRQVAGPNMTAPLYLPNELQNRLTGFVGEAVIVTPYLSTAGIQRPSDPNAAARYDAAVARYQPGFQAGVEINQWVYSLKDGVINPATTPEIVNKQASQISTPVPVTSNIAYGADMGE